MSLDEAPGRILVVNVSRIGDTLLVTPAVRALAAAWPQAEITFLAHPKRREVIDNLPFVRRTGAITKRRSLWRGWLPGKRWDLALVYGFDESLIRFALRVSRRVAAFRQASGSLNARLACSVERPAPLLFHAADTPLRLTRALGVPDAGKRLAYRVSEAEKQWARSLLASSLPKGAHPLVGFQVASFPTRRYRDWPPESFAALWERLVERWPDAHLLLFGGDTDVQRTGALAARYPGKASSLAGKLTLRQSAALLNELDLYVGVDTGPTHIMGALGAPMVALYHCHAPSHLLKPLDRPRLYVVDHPRAGRDSSPEAPMAEITVDMVWARVLEALGSP